MSISLKLDTTWNTFLFTCTVKKNQTSLCYIFVSSSIFFSEKEMATHSSVLARRIPGMGEPDGLLSLGSHRVRHNWSDLAAAAAYLRLGLPQWLRGKESTCNAGATGNVIPGPGRSPGGGHGNPLHYSCLKNLGIEEPGKLQSKGQQRLGHDWVTNHPHFGLIFPKQVCQRLVLACFTSYVNRINWVFSII